MTDGPFWIPLAAPGRLATMPRPRGGDWLEWDLTRLHAQGVTGLVSLLERSEEEELELTREAAACAEIGLSFRSQPVPDVSIPRDAAGFWSMARTIHADVLAGGSIVTHCRAGIGRSSLLAAAVLTLFGSDPATAFATIATARGCRVPDTDAQRAWFENAARDNAARGMPPRG